MVYPQTCVPAFVVTGGEMLDGIASYNVNRRRPPVNSGRKAHPWHRYWYEMAPSATRFPYPFKNPTPHCALAAH